MKKLTQDEVNKIIKNHLLWLRNEGGERADFRVSVKHGEFSEEEFEKFLSFELQYHLQELDELAQQAANEAY